MDDLYDKVSAARQDVSMFDFNDLLKLDYKSCDPGVHRAGIASIMSPFRAVLEKYERSCHTNKAQALSQLTAAEVSTVWASLEQFREQKALDVVLGFTKKCPIDGKKHLLISVSSAGIKGDDMAQGLVEFLIGTPDTLPQDLLADRNLQKQGVSKKGLGAQQACKFVETGRVLVVLELAARVTRKSLKPIIESWLAKI